MRGQYPTKLSIIRNRATELCREKGTVTVDDLRTDDKLQSVIHFENIPGETWSGVFRSREFRKVGFMVSTRPENHGRYINVWALS